MISKRIWTTHRVAQQAHSLGCYLHWISESIRRETERKRQGTLVGHEIEKEVEETSEIDELTVDFDSFL